MVRLLLYVSVVFALLLSLLLGLSACSRKEPAAYRLDVECKCPPPPFKSGDSKKLDREYWLPVVGS